MKATSENDTHCQCEKSCSADVPRGTPPAISLAVTILVLELYNLIAKVIVSNIYLQSEDAHDCQ